MRGLSLTQPMLTLFLRGEFLLHIPSCLHFYAGSFSYTSRAGCHFIRGLSLTHPMLASFLSRGVSLTHPVLASFLSEEFLLHIPRWLHFYEGSFSYTSHTGFILMWGVSLTHPRLSSFHAGSFSYTSLADLFFIWGVSLTHPVLAFSSFFFFFFFFFKKKKIYLFMWGPSFLCSLLWRQSLKKRAGWKLAQEKSVKMSHSNQRTIWTEQNKTKQKPNEKWAWKGKERNGSEL